MTAHSPSDTLQKKIMEQHPLKEKVGNIWFYNQWNRHFYSYLKKKPDKIDHSITIHFKRNPSSRKNNKYQIGNLDLHRERKAPKIINMWVYESIFLVLKYLSKIANWFPLARQLNWLECCPVHQKGCRFDMVKAQYNKMLLHISYKLWIQWHHVGRLKLNTENIDTTKIGNHYKSELASPRELIIIYEYITAPSISSFLAQTHLG